MTESEEMLYTRIDEVLFYQWDPIGVSTSAWARDEYQPYLASLFDLLISNDNATAVAEYLNTVSTETMGLNLGGERDLEIAEFLLELKEVYLE
ncbi:MAG: hypothetical protein ACI9WC_002898 [Arenicella sp.]|jgi:hypothetical protein